MRIRGIWWIALIALGFSTLAAADVVVLANGDRITGEVKRVWDEELFIETEYADEFPISLDQIVSIETDEVMEIELRDHTKVEGRLALDESGTMVLVTEEQTLPFAPSGIEELEEIEDGFDWEARSDLSFKATEGNSETMDTRWQAALTVKKGDHRHGAHARLEQIEQEGTTTRDQTTLGYRYSWFFAERWFFAAGTGYERDPVRDLDLRVTPGAGIGHQFFDDAYRLFEFSLGVAGIREEIAGVREDSSAAQWDMRYRRKVLKGDLEFFHDQKVWHYVAGRENTVVETRTGIRWDLWRDIYMNAQVNWDWEAEPAAGAEKEDVTYALGVGVEFD